MSNYLSEEELTELTGYTWHRKRCQALATMRIRFMVNPRGKILVSRDVRDDLPMKKHLPNWEAIKG